MGARLNALYDALEETLGARYDGKITFQRGASDANQNDAPPRVVWVPTQGVFTPPEKASRKNRQVFVRNPVIQARCWGKDADEAEQLVHDLAWELYRTAWGAIELLGEEWPPDAATHNGVLVIVTFIPHIPVEEPEKRTVKATSFEKDASGSAVDDGYIDWGEGES